MAGSPEQVTGMLSIILPFATAEMRRMILPGKVYSLAFSPDGKYVLSDGFDKAARVWLWHPDDLIRQTCDNVIRNLTRDEWNTYLPDQPYEAICPELSIEPENTPTAFP